jgi:hypothetical protein
LSGSQYKHFDRLPQGRPNHDLASRNADAAARHLPLAGTTPYAGARFKTDAEGPS